MKSYDRSDFPWHEISSFALIMTSKIFRLGIAATLAAVMLLAPGCALLLGGATGAGVGAIAGSTTNSNGSAATVGGLGGAAGGALVGAAVGDPLVGAVAGGLGGAATGYEVKKNSSGD
ncbi:MAG: hypothetical protein WAU33_15225 [Candidatus Binataceae bacterium]